MDKSKILRRSASLVRLFAIAASLHGIAANAQTPPPSQPVDPVLQHVTVTGQTVPSAPPTFPMDVGIDLSGAYGALPTQWTSGNQDKDTQANNSNPDCSKVPRGSNPVILQTGEKDTTEVDFQSRGLYGLSMTRRYRSNSVMPGMFGNSWRSSYDFSLNTSGGSHTSCFQSGGTCYPPLVNVFFPDGSHYTYGLDTQHLTYSYGNSDRMGTFTIQPGATELWTLTTTDGVFGFNSGGVLIRETTPNGVLLQSINGTTVSNTAGQTISFNYVGGKVHTVVDPNQQVWTYDYNANGMLSKVTSPNGHIRTYGYDATQTSELTSISVDGVQTLAVSWYSNGKVQQSGTPDGESVDSYSYGANSTTLTTQSGDPQTYTFGTHGSTGVNHAATGTCAAAFNTIAYDANGYTDYTIDFNGVKTDYTYDASGLLRDVTTEAGTPNARKTTTSWAIYGINRETGKVFYNTAGVAYKSITYNRYTTPGPSFGMLKSEIDKDLIGGTLIAETDYGYAFDSSNHLLQETVTRQLPSGAATSTTNYDSSGNLTSIVDAAGNTTSYSSYDGLGQAHLMTSPGGASSTFEYDPYGNITRTVHTSSNGTSASTFTYDGDNHVVGYVLASGESSTQFYTAGGRLYKAIDQAGKIKNFSFSPATNTFAWNSERDSVSWSGSSPAISVAGLFGGSTRYDTRGRLWSESGNNGQLVSYTFDKQGNQVSQKDSAGSTTGWTPDGRGQIVGQSNADGGQLRFTRGDDGQLSTVQTSRGVVFQYKRNGLGGLNEFDNPDSGNVIYKPDAFGRAATESRANGTSVSYSWDGLDRLLTRQSASALENYRYDEGHGKEKLSSFSNANTSRTYTFDNDANAVAQTDVIFGQTFSQSRRYGASNQLIQATYPSGLQLAYVYGSNGRLASISSNVPSASVILSQVVYQPNGGSISGWLMGNGMGHAIAQDADGRVVGISTGGVQNSSYSYNSDNSLGSQTDSVQPTVNGTFSYDANKRISTVVRSGDNQNYVWDVDSNISSSTVSGSSYSYGYPSNSNRLATLNGAAISYMAGGGDFYGWANKAYSRDEFDRLATFYLSGSAVAQYRYDALDQRVYKSLASGTTYYLYDPEGRLNAEVTNGAETDYIWLGGALVGIYRSGQVYFVATDNTARPQVVTNSVGAVVWRANNSTFSRQVVMDSIGGLNIGFPGQYFDAESGMYYNWHRYYDPSIGRYIESDPSGLGGGNNSYVYATGNPISTSDFSGLDTPAMGPYSSEVTVYYYGPPPGHVGLGVNGGTSLGLYGNSGTTGSDALLSGSNAYAALLNDVQQQGTGATSAVVLKVSVDQASKVKNRLDALKANAGAYNLYTNNCATSAEATLRGAGVLNVPTTIFPDTLINQLSGHK